MPERTATLTASSPPHRRCQVVMAVPPPPIGEFTGFSYPAASFASGGRVWSGFQASAGNLSLQRSKCHSHPIQRRGPDHAFVASSMTRLVKESGCYILEALVAEGRDMVERSWRAAGFPYRPWAFVHRVFRRCSELLRDTRCKALLLEQSQTPRPGRRWKLHHQEL